MNHVALIIAIIVAVLTNTRISHTQKHALKRVVLEFGLVQLKEGFVHVFTGGRLCWLALWRQFNLAV